MLAKMFESRCELIGVDDAVLANRIRLLDQLDQIGDSEWFRRRTQNMIVELIGSAEDASSHARSRGY